MGIGEILALVGGVKSLLDPPEDPNADIRQRLEGILDQMKTRYPQLREIAKQDVSIAADEAINRITDTARGGQLPTNVLLQKEGEIYRDAGRERTRRLASIGLQEQGALSDMAKISGSLPPAPQDTFGEDVLSTGLQLMNTATSEDGEVNVLDTLSNLVGGDVNIPGVIGSAAKGITGDVGTGVSGGAGGIGTVLKALLAGGAGTIDQLLQLLKNIYPGNSAPGYNMTTYNAGSGTTGGTGLRL